MTLTLDAITARHLACAAALMLTTPEELAARFLRLVLASCDVETTRAEQLEAWRDLRDWRGDIIFALEGEQP